MNWDHLSQLIAEVDSPNLSKKKCMLLYQQLDDLLVNQCNKFDFSYIEMIKQLQTLINRINLTIQFNEFSDQIIVNLLAQLKTIGVCIQIIQNLDNQNSQQYFQICLQQLLLKIQETTFRLIEQNDLYQIFETEKIQYFHIFVQTWRYYLIQLWKFIIQGRNNIEMQQQAQNYMLQLVESELLIDSSSNILRSQFFYVIFSSMNVFSLKNFYENFASHLIQIYEENQVQGMILIFFNCIVSKQIINESQDQQLLEQLKIQIVKSLLKNNYFMTLKLYIQIMVIGDSQKLILMNQIFKQILEKYNQDFKQIVTSDRQLLEFYQTQQAFLSLIIQNSKLSTILYKKNLWIFQRQNAGSQYQIMDKFIKIQSQLVKYIDQKKELEQYLFQVLQQIDKSDLINQIEVQVNAQYAIQNIDIDKSYSLKINRDDMIKLCLMIMSNQIQSNGINLNEHSGFEQKLKQQLNDRYLNQERQKLNQEKLINFQLISKLDEITNSFKQIVQNGLANKNDQNLFCFYIINKLKLE